MKVIATDLDRTLIPNGSHKSDPNSMNLFKNLLKKNDFELIFVTGRSKQLIKDAIKRYSLPKPSYCISMVGTKIYKYEKNKLINLDDYEFYLKKSKCNYDVKKIKDVLKIENLKPQLAKNQNEFKQSYNFYGKESDVKKILNKIKNKIQKNKIDCNLIKSYDKNRNVWMIDILHPKATKKLALEYLMKRLNVKKTNVIYSGDSGNDLDMFKSNFKSILVKNASQSIKKEVKKFNVYIAKGNYQNLNGNYVSGIIEGINYYYKDLK